MASIFTSLVSVANSLGTMEKALNVVSNNVTNSKTPGFVRQEINFIAKPFDTRTGLSGGVEAGSLISSRRVYLDRGVLIQSHRFGQFSQQTQILEQVEPIFDVGNQSGLAAAMDRLFHSFSQLSITPNGRPAREAVIRAAQDVATAFNRTTGALGQVSAQADTELRTSIEVVNRIGDAIRRLNIQLRQDARRLSDPGLDAQINAELERLAEHVDFTFLRAEDGSYSIYLGGQGPLVLGDKLFPISGDFSGDGPLIRDFDGKDITGQIQGGRIRGILDLRTSFLPSVLADLNQLAAGLADKVNEGLINGLDQNGQTPEINLFSYDPIAGAAGTLAVTNIEPHQLAAAVPEAPGGNGNALNLASLATARVLDEYTFSQFYGQLAGRVGRNLANARDDERAHSLLLSQSRLMRAEITEVSLDEEAAKLIQFQRAYQAAAELVRVLNTLTQDMINLIR
jgi:flagellar hook-associated protein 1 FlgK